MLAPIRCEKWWLFTENDSRWQVTYHHQIIIVDAHRYKKNKLTQSLCSTDAIHYRLTRSDLIFQIFKWKSPVQSANWIWILFFFILVKSNTTANVRDKCEDIGKSSYFTFALHRRRRRENEVKEINKMYKPELSLGMTKTSTMVTATTTTPPPSSTVVMKKIDSMKKT